MTHSQSREVSSSSRDRSPSSISVRVVEEKKNIVVSKCKIKMSTYCNESDMTLVKKKS